MPDIYAKSATGSDWTHVGYTTEPISFQGLAPKGFTVDDVRLPAPGTVIASLRFPITDEAFPMMHLMFGDLHRPVFGCGPGHCRICHPEMAPRPLAVDGRAYHQRRQARQRRKNR
jgi:hypothetical protein